jgi:TolB-like protein/Flp pilus assembly protein TadD
VRFVVGYAVAAWVVAQVVGFFVEQGYTGRTILDVVLFLLIVGFFAMLVIVWYHGEGGRQGVERLEAVLLAICIVVAVAGSFVIAGRDAPAVALDLEVQPVVDLGDRSVAVLPFENDLEDPSMSWLDRGISELLATDLSQIESVRVVGGQRIIDLMRQIGEADRRIVPEEQRTRVTRLAGARYMLSGRIAGRADNVVLVASLIDTDTGEIAAAARSQGADVFELVDAVSAQVSAALAPASSGAMASVADMTTQSLEAYAEYQRGIEARNRFLFRQAGEHFETAIGLDSTFALAHFQLAGVQVQTGDFGGSSESLRLAREYLTHAAPRDRMYIEGLGAMISGDLEGGERRLRELIARFPDEKEARVTLAAVKRGRGGASDEVARLVEETLRLDPLYAPGYNDLAYTEAGRGNYDSALALIDTYVTLEPGQPNPIDSRGEILLMAGRVDAGREAFRQALDVDPTFTLALRHLVESYLRSDEGAAARQDLALSTSSEYPAVRAVARLLEAETWFWDGDIDRGLAAVEAAYRDPDPDPAQHVNALRTLLFAKLQTGRYEGLDELGAEMSALSALEGSHEIAAIVSAGEEGRLDDLSRAGDRMTAQFRDTPGLEQFLPVAMSMSAIWNAFYRQEHERVVQLAAEAPFRFGETGTEQLGYPVMRSLLALGQGDRAASHVDVALRAGITGVPGAWDSLTRRILQYYRGRAYEATGDTARAAEAYRGLIDAWGSTTAELPLIADIDDRLEALGS